MAREFDRKVGLGCTARQALEIIRAQALSDQRQEAPEDAVLVQVGDLVEIALDLLDEPFAPLLRNFDALRVEAPLEEAHQLRGDLVMRREGVLHISLA